MKEGTINTPREQIDEIDREILKLLNRRTEIALKVGEAKTAANASLCDPVREDDVISRLQAENQGPLDKRGVANIFHRIIDESLGLQQHTYQRKIAMEQNTPESLIPGRSRVAFLGDQGTFSETAALAILGDDCETVSFPTFEDLFTSIDSGKADYILAPLENSLIGSVHRCVDLLLDSSLSITADVILPVSHYLVACPEATLETLTTVESHPAAIAQCRRFFAAHPHLKAVPADDTAGSVRRAVESGDVTRAGIGSKRTSELYGGKILREHLEDNSENYTRFALLSQLAEEREAGAKLTLVLKLKNQPGALHTALRPFVRRAIDLLKIESLPIRDSPGDFYFYLDVQTPVIEGDLQGALAELREMADEFRSLGRYSTTRLSNTN
ncbi:MAG: prephenate dehydratase domain-containing protein [Acidobacteriota bacterium]